MQKLQPGMICLLTHRYVSTTNRKNITDRGTPVKIVSIEEPSCLAKSSNGCQAYCKRKCPHIITAEVAGGRQLSFKYVDDDVTEDDDDFPFLILDDKNIEFLLSKSAYRQYKILDDYLFIPSRWKPFPIRLSSCFLFFSLSAAVVDVARELSNPYLSYFFIVMGIRLCLYGLSALCATIVYHKREITYTEYAFFENYEENRKGLEHFAQVLK